MRNSISPFIRAIALVIFALAGILTQWTAHAAPSSAAPQGPQTSNWEQQAPYPTRFAINGVDMVTPTEAWVVAYTDILHTTDSGATWENQPRPGADNLYAVDFFDNQHGIAMGNTTLYTRDGGHTWNQSNGTFGEDVEMADANLAFITDHRVAGYMRSTDGGATWSFRTMPSNITTIQCFDSLNCVAASPSGVYHSYDGGLNWSFVAGQGVEFAGTYFVSHDQGWIVLGNNASHTTDGGATWQVQTLPGGTWIYDVMFSDASNGWAVGDNMVRTTDGGANWQQVPLQPESLPLWDVDFVDAQHGIAGGDSFLGTESVIITSSDGGANWNTRTNGSINEVVDIVALDRDHAWASHSYGGKTSRTTDGGATWRVTEVGEQYVVLSGIDMANSLEGWTVGYETTFLEGRIYHTTDGGATWQQQFDPNAQYLLGVAALDAQTAIVVGGYSGSGSIRERTTDGGATWHSLNVPIGAFFYDVFFLDSQTGWMVGGNGDIVKSTDGGDTWVVQNNPAQYTLASVHFSDPNNGWAGGYYGTLVHTTNGGATWTLQDPQIPEYTHVLDVRSTSPTRGWIAGYGGGAQSRPFVKYTTDGGATWIEHTPPVGPYDSFSALAFVDDEYGWAAGAGGIFRHGGSSPPPSATVTPTASATALTASPTATQTATSTSTVLSTMTVTATTTPTEPTATGTPPTSTATSTPLTPTPTSTACAIQFTDVPVGSTFYDNIHCLACRGIVNGYPCGAVGEPCDPNNNPYFRPANTITRAQLSKIVSNAAGFTDAQPDQLFEDVPLSSTFHDFIGRLATRGYISGYPCGGLGEPCGPNNLPYFRPNNQASRGQISKIDSNAANYLEDPTGQQFEDVQVGSTYYTYTYRLVLHNVMSGYPCGGAGEPCGPNNLPYFRPNASATRGQTSKIVGNTFYPQCTP